MSNGYSKSFRVKVAKEATQPEMKGMEEHIARKYGLRPSTVEKWAAIYREFGENGLGKKISIPTKKSDREIQLEKEVAELQEEVAILKKAAAFLAEVGRR
jgi:transposase